MMPTKSVTHEWTVNRLKGDVEEMGLKEARVLIKGDQENAINPLFGYYRIQVVGEWKKGDESMIPGPMEWLSAQFNRSSRW